MSRLLTVAETLEYLSIDKDTLTGLLRDGDLPCVKLGGELRFKEHDLDEWISANTSSATDDPEILSLLGTATDSITDTAAETDYDESGTLERLQTRPHVDIPLNEPFIIEERDGRFLITVIDSDAARKDIDRIIEIVSAAAEKDAAPDVEQAISSQGTAIELGETPTFLDESFNVLVTEDRLTACVFIPSDIAAGFSPSPEKLKAELNRLGIVAGYDEAAISAIGSPDAIGRLITVARGRSASSGSKTPHIKLCFKTPPGFNPNSVESAGFDIRTLDEISQVSAGKPVAELITEGAKNAFDVFGEHSHFLDNNGRIILKGGANTRYSEDKTKLLASSDGIVYMKKGAICVEPVLVFPEVSLRDGKIETDGKVIVLGDAKNGAYIEAKKKILVRGQMHAARLISTKGSIEVIGGIVGGSKASVTASGNITTAFVENCALTAGMSVKISNAIMRCSVKAGKSIVMTSDRARVAASDLSAGVFMSLVSVGSSNALRTILTIEQLSDDKTGTERKHLKELISDILNDMRMCKLRLNRLRDRGAPEFRDEDKKLAALKKTYTKYTKNLSDFLKWTSDPERIFIEASGEIMPGVEIYIEDKMLEIKHVHRAERFHYTTGGITSVKI